MFDTTEFSSKFSKLVSVLPKDLKAETVLETIEEWDSMAVVGTAAMIFELTNQSVNPEELEQLKTYGDVVNLATAKYDQSVQVVQ